MIYILDVVYPLSRHLKFLFASTLYQRSPFLYAKNSHATVNRKMSMTISSAMPYPLKNGMPSMALSCRNIEFGGSSAHKANSPFIRKPSNPAASSPAACGREYYLKNRDAYLGSLKTLKNLISGGIDDEGKD